MVWPLTDNTLVAAFQRSNNIIKDIKKQTLAISVVQDINRVEFLRYYERLTGAVNTLNTAKTIPGIAAYAQAQLNDPALDVAAEFTAVVDAIETLRVWIVANFPVGAGGALLYHTLNESTGELVNMQFTIAQLATFRSEAAVLLATIG